MPYLNRPRTLYYLMGLPFLLVSLLLLAQVAFTSTPLGQGLQLSGPSEGDGQGFHWNAYAHLLVHPYTIEMIVTPEETQSYRKLFSFNDDTATGRFEQLSGVVDEVRLSNVARTAVEIQAVQNTLSP